MRAPLSILSFFLLLCGLCAGLVPHWGSCQATSDCDRTLVQGKPVCCHVGDRRCLTMDDCDWVNWIEKAPEPRNCECIADRGGNAKRWDSCRLSSDCDPGPTANGQRLCCHEGDRRCLTKDDCEWANMIGHTRNDCSCHSEEGQQHCYNGCRDLDLGETDVDCGRGCDRKCPSGYPCNVGRDCENGHCDLNMGLIHSGVQDCPGKHHEDDGLQGSCLN
eukprot:m51a1_g10227 hypothetical protein (218) ;mRNA; r:140333-140986